MWKGIHRVLPIVQIFGCFFHWAQVVWRKVQALGLQFAYTSDNATHKYIKMLMSLPYLPAAHIQPILPECQDFMPLGATVTVEPIPSSWQPREQQPGH